MHGDASAGNREQEISGISRGLKAISKELKVPAVVLSQLDRAVERRSKGKRLQLSDPRENGSMEAAVELSDNAHLLALVLEQGTREEPRRESRAHVEPDAMPPPRALVVKLSILAGSTRSPGGADDE